MPQDKKRQKVSDNGNAFIVDAEEKVNKIQEELSTLDEELHSKISALTEENHRKKLPLFSKRDKSIQSIPQFWKSVILAHPLSDLCSEIDKNVLNFLTNLTVREPESSEGMITLCLSFSDNPYFSNAELWYKWSADSSDDEDEESEDKEAETSGFDWKSTSEAEELKKLVDEDDEEEDDESGGSFFSLFDKGSVGHEHILHVIREELYPNAWVFYQEMKNQDSEEEA
mmetsp:Transcript_25922/g.26133  ORF Transcript_25922/g.26133 Transcript_25922/m.26133 type:complete len:227 (-) Transcript_25922:285-965(-)|eukprot:CAMPEP_0182423878 /NCGR_PEP_ID=MMETSP1167-20130531/9963_1 /TAXON_ID=2988 /ORGANISM="Mallomonas Sp, Strain CCMP3275" /LENGTH=226 /DNA_ID=CAMNT_0024603207 /DNA_START=55 /DNA_END=735 /DNA_ORIENTATION=-